MHTHQITVTLPDVAKFDDRAALQMQVLYVKSLVNSRQIDFDDPAQRDAVLEWYLEIVPHIQPTAEENQAAKDAFWKEMGWPMSNRPVAEIVADIDARMAELGQKNSWDGATYEAWAHEHTRTSGNCP